MERKHTGVGDWGVRAVEDMVRFLATVVHRLVADLRDRAAVITERQAGHTAHVAVLALDALLARWRRSVLLPDHLELDARVHGDLMARRAELAAGERLEVDAGGVHLLAGALVGRRALNLVLLLVVNGLGHAIARDAAEDRGEDVAGLDASLAVRLSVDVLHTVAGDAGDPF